MSPAQPACQRRWGPSPAAMGRTCDHRCMHPGPPPRPSVFDTAFHAASLPRVAYTYALPLDLCQQLSIRRWAAERWEGVALSWASVPRWLFGKATLEPPAALGSASMLPAFPALPAPRQLWFPRHQLPVPRVGGGAQAAPRPRRAQPDHLPPGRRLLHHCSAQWRVGGALPLELTPGQQVETA